MNKSHVMRGMRDRYLTSGNRDDELPHCACVICLTANGNISSVQIVCHKS